MKIGFCMLLWTTAVDESHRALLEDIKATGYDGVEIPIFEGTPDDYASISKMLDDIGLDRTAIAVIPELSQNPISEDPAHRQAGADHLRWLVDCAAALGANTIGGPLHQTIGHFSGAATTPDEFARAREVHLSVADHAQDNDITFALEAINRFESYFANTQDDLCAYTRAVGHPAIKTSTTHSTPILKNATLWLISAALWPTSCISTFRKTTGAFLGEATFHGQKPSRRSRPADMTGG